MAYVAIRPRAFGIRRRIPYLYGLGVTEAEYQACLATQGAYQADLAAWNQEKIAYDAAVKQRLATITAQTASFANAMAMYQTLHVVWQAAKQKWDAYVSQLASIAAGYAMKTAQVTGTYGLKVLTGTPTCVPSDVHTKLANECYLFSNPVKGLGAFDWMQYDTRALACFGAALPICAAAPTAPPQPGPEPQPPVAPSPPPQIPAMRPKPVAPAACVAPPTPAPPPPLPPTPTPTVTAAAALAPAAPVIIPAAPIIEAAAPTPVVESKATGGLLVVGLLVLAAGGIWAMTRPRPARTT